MSTHDYVIANQTGANTRSDLNNAFSAIVSNNSSASEPATMYAYQWWADTANDLLKQRNAANSAWISILTLSTGAVTSGGDPTMGGDLTGTASNAQIAANAVGLAEMAHGTDGELITYDAAGAPANVAVGTSGQVLTSGGAGVAPTFQTAASGGKVLQVIQTVYKDATTVSSTSYISTPVTASITPSSTSSKILVRMSINVGSERENGGMRGRLYRNASNITDSLGNAAGSRERVWFLAGSSYSESDSQVATPEYLDSPTSTSEQTYTLYVKKNVNNFTINGSKNDGDYSTYYRGTSMVTLMEIGV